MAGSSPRVSSGRTDVAFSIEPSSRPELRCVSLADDPCVPLTPESPAFRRLREADALAAFPLILPAAQRLLAAARSSSRCSASVRTWAWSPKPVFQRRDERLLVATLTKGLALELAERGIRVVHVAPGEIATGTSTAPEYAAERQSVTWRRQTPMGRAGTPEEIAAIVAFLCTEQASFVTGSSIVVDGGYLTY